MWSSSAGNSFECSKSTVLARMVSGRYRTEMMCRFWSTNRMGYCLADTCQQVSGDLVHLLAICPALELIRNRLHSLWCLKTINCPPLHSFILKILGSDSLTQVKFLLSSVSFPEIIHLTQTFGQQILDTVMYLTRTWVFAVHRHKQKLLGRWPGGVMYQNKPNKVLQRQFHQDRMNDNPDLPALNQTDTMLFNPLCYSTNDLPFSGSSTFPTSSTQTDYMSQSAPVPEGPAMPTGSIRVSPSRHNRVSGQGQQDGQLVRSSVQSFILSVILQNNPNFHDYEPSTLPLKNDN